MISYNVAPFTEKVFEYMQDAVNNKKICGDGKYTKFCNRWFEVRTGSPKVMLTTSCSHALEMAALLLDIKPGDEVIMPSFTFVSTANAFVLRGAKIIYVDIRPDTMNMDETLLEAAITDKTRAIVPVHYAGVACEMDTILDIARRHNLKVIEDAAHCFGDERIANRDGIFCFSFDPIKNISCGDGGCILTTHTEITERLKDMRLLGVIGDTERRFQGKRSWNSDVKELGWRLHMNNIAAAIGRAQLAKFSEIRMLRQRNANMYLAALADISEIQLFPINAKTAVPHIFPIIVKNGRRNELQKYLADAGIETGVQYKPNHLLSYFNMGYALPNAEKLYDEILSLPIHPLVTEDDMAYIISIIRRFF